MLRKFVGLFVAIAAAAGCGNDHTSTNDSVSLQSESKSVSAKPEIEGVWASSCIDYWNGSYSIKTDFRW